VSLRSDNFQDDSFNEIDSLYNVEPFEEGESSPYIGRIEDRVLQAMSEEKIPSISYAPVFLKPFEKPLTAEQRVKNTVEIAESQETLPFSFPEVIHREDTEIETEYVSGRMLSDYIIEKPEEQVHSVVSEIGENLKQLHDKGWALRDLHPYNIKVDESFEDSEIYIVDAEYATPRADILDRFYDHASFSDGIHNLETNKNTEEILECFQDSYELSQLYQQAVKNTTQLKNILIG